STHTVSRTEAAPPRHVTRVTSTSACQPIALVTGSSRSVPTTVTERGARRRRSDVSRRACARPPQPTAHRKTPRISSVRAASGPRRPSVAAAETATTAAGSLRARPARPRGSPRRDPGAATQDAARIATPTTSQAHAGHAWSAWGRPSHARRPAQNAPAASGAPHAPTGSHRHLGPQLLERRRPDPRNPIQLIDGRERSLVGPVLDDGGGERGPDTVQRLEGRFVGGVDVDERDPARAGGAGRGAARRRAFLGHEDLLAVGERRREVEQREVGTIACASRALHRVDHP